MTEILNKVKKDVPELLGGKKDSEKIKAILGELNFNIKAYISKESDDKFNSDVRKIVKYLDEDINYVVLLLFLQIGKPDEEFDKVFEYKNKNDMRICLQLKIKSYIPFISKESAEKYMKEELTDNDLAVLAQVSNGITII